MQELVLALQQPALALALVPKLMLNLELALALAPQAVLELTLQLALVHHLELELELEPAPKKQCVPVSHRCRHAVGSRPR